MLPPISRGSNPSHFLQNSCLFKIYHHRIPELKHLADVIIQPLLVWPALRSMRLELL